MDPKTVVKFAAINVYDEENSDNEENSQELQVEQALKIYAKALKFHTNRNWEDAAAAYEELFQNEALKNTQNLPTTLRNGPTSLALLIHLSNKNYGEFLLERLKSTAKLDKTVDPIGTMAKALQLFATALIADDTDAALWRRAAQLSSLLGLPQVARYCLDSIVDGDGIVKHFTEERLASEQLKRLLNSIGDDASLSDERYRKFMKRKLDRAFQARINPYPWLTPLPEPAPLGQVLAEESGKTQQLEVPTKSWGAIGKAILSQHETLEDDDEEPQTEGWWVLQFNLPPDTADSPESEADMGEDVNSSTAQREPRTPEQTRATPQTGSNSRKRKPSTQGPTEDSGRSRLSKRVRDRESNAAAAAAAAAAVPAAPLVREVLSQDKKLFKTANEFLLPFDISLGSTDDLKTRPEEDLSGKPELYLQDFQTLLRNWDDDKGNILLYGDGIESPDELPGMALVDLDNTSYHSGGKSNVPEKGVGRWVRSINNAKLPLLQVSLEWLKALLFKSDGPSTYRTSQWNEELRHNIYDILAICDDMLWEHVGALYDELKKRSCEPDELHILEWPQMIFELYLGDLIETEKEVLRGEGGELAKESLVIKKLRAQRWANRSSDFLSIYPDPKATDTKKNELAARYLWANVVLATFSGRSREFIMCCFKDLEVILHGAVMIQLPNSIAMPEVSARKAEREISKLKTMDFFGNIFEASNEMSDPERVVLSLEAVLDPREASMTDWDDEVRSRLEEMADYLNKSSTQFKVYLWEKLREAYETIGNDDQKRILECRLKCIDIVTSDLVTEDYLNGGTDHRHFVLLRGLRKLDDLVSATLELCLHDQWNVLVDLDVSAIKATMTNLGILLRILHTYAFYEDGVLNKEYKGSDLHSYRLATAKFREMLVRTWCTMYLFYREAAQRQRKESGDHVEPQLLRLLSDIHDELGARYYCKLSDHVFLKLMQSELLRIRSEDFDQDLAQVLKCRFHLEVGTDLFVFNEHKTDVEPFTKKVAYEVLDFFLELASRKKPQQLPKSDIREGIEKLIEVIGVPTAKGNNKIAYNELSLEKYLSSSINPIELSRCLKGGLDISMVKVKGEIARVAEKGLYFIEGNIHLAPMRFKKVAEKFRVEEFQEAVRFFKYDLLCDSTSWEVWYRLAQAYDCMTDQDMTFSADNINNNVEDLIYNERRAILCYMMAASASMDADDNPDIHETLSQMWADFGNRIYSAARMPMKGQSFETDDFPRHFSGMDNEGLYTRQIHNPISADMAFRFAKVLYERALVHGDSNWKNWYMLGKCLEKMENQGDLEPFDPQPKDGDGDVDVVSSKKRKNVEPALQCLIKAIQRLPTRGDAIFEPHHKLVSLIFKYGVSGHLDIAKGSELMVQNTQYAKNLKLATTKEEFEALCLTALKNMRAADKAKWHHRMTARMARYYEKIGDFDSAAKEMASLFSQKGCGLSMWRPDHERAGRYFYYASFYTLLYAAILSERNTPSDRANLEALMKKVRKNHMGLFEHVVVYEQVCLMFVMALREAGQIPEKFEDKVFKTVSFEEFNNISQKMEFFYSNPANATPTFDIFRDVQEIRRTSSGMGKIDKVEDLQNDVYAKLYQEFAEEEKKRQATEKEEKEKEKEMEKEKEEKKLLETPTRVNPMSLHNLVADTTTTTPLDSARASPAANGAITPSNPPIATPTTTDEGPRKIAKVSKRDIASKISSLIRQLPKPIAPGTTTGAIATTPEATGGTGGTRAHANSLSGGSRIGGMRVNKPSSSSHPDNRVSGATDVALRAVGNDTMDPDSTFGSVNVSRNGSPGYDDRTDVEMGQDGDETGQEGYEEGDGEEGGDGGDGDDEDEGDQEGEEEGEDENQDEDGDEVMHDDEQG